MSNKKSVANSKFNCIALLDAIPDGELNTARRLHEGLFDHKNANAEKLGRLHLRYFKIENEDDLGECIDGLIAESEADDLIPWLHLEAHGLENKTGFITADRTPISWEKLNKLITPLNVSTNLNLVLILASCYGAYYIQAMGPSQRSAVLALIGPINEVLAAEVEADFHTFYMNMFNNFSFGKAAKAIAETNEGPVYYATNAEELFLEAWKGYRNNHCSNKALKARALALIQRLRRENPSVHYKIGFVKKMLKEKESEFFDKYRDIYFLYDIDPRNRTRFPVTYQRALEYLAH